MKVADRIGGYILTGELGRGISASTWLARPAEPDPTQSSAVLKILDLSETSSWNMVDIFRRESEALKNLSHPGIPKYFEYFESGEEGRLRLVLAMEHIEGENLEKIVRSGRKFSETEIERILAELADILAYLGSLRPPIVHRDVNPRNIIMRPDGSIALVDFSGVQDAVRTALFPGATLVGTAGYIPLEQVGGKATHRSDLYGAAATAVFLITGRNPSELPTKSLKIDLSGLVDVSAKLSAVLSSWLDPDVTMRNLPASAAASILRGDLEIPEKSKSSGLRGDAWATPSDIPAKEKSRFPENLPADSKIIIEQSDESVSVKIPRVAARGSAVPGTMFATVWIGFVAFWTMMTFMMRTPFFFPVFSIPFWGVGIFMAKKVLGPALAKHDILINRETFYVHSQILGFEREASWPLQDIGGIRVVPSRMQFNGAQSKELSLEAGTRHIRLGTGLSERELQYLEKFLMKEVDRLRER
ncbi:MAG TPA: serine/threonine-protein kinase [Rectinemataceae bacterium]|nr:serine/threonine-protein kinase [Rectinemataceae bacterium]